MALAADQIPVAGTQSMLAHVRVKQVDKQYGGKTTVLKQIDLDIDYRQFVSVVGPSGCGKSTLLKCIAGLTGISSGTIEVAGKTVTEPSLDMAVVFQRDILLDWRRVLDNVLLPIEFRRENTAAWKARAQEILGLMGLEGYDRRYPWELSGGQRQRVAIARALIQDPALLLMDEPFGALDALTRDELNLELQRIWMTAHKTVLFITHGISEAVFLADKVVVMGTSPGRVIEEIPIDLPRPRTLDMRETQKFSHYAKHIRGVFQSMGFLKGA